MKMTNSLAEISGWIFAMTGGLFCIMSFYSPAFDLVNNLLIPSNKISDVTTKLYAHVMGSVMVGYGVTIALISKSIKMSPGNIVNSMIVGAVSWFVIDTTGSLLHGSWQNALFNLVGLILLVPPLLILKKSILPGSKV